MCFCYLRRWCRKKCSVDLVSYFGCGLQWLVIIKFVRDAIKIWGLIVADRKIYFPQFVYGNWRYHLLVELDYNLPLLFWWWGNARLEHKLWDDLCRLFVTFFKRHLNSLYQRTTIWSSFCCSFEWPLLSGTAISSMFPLSTVTIKFSPKHLLSLEMLSRQKLSCLLGSSFSRQPSPIGWSGWLGKRASSSKTIVVHLGNLPGILRELFFELDSP